MSGTEIVDSGAGYVFGVSHVGGGRYVGKYGVCVGIN